jgi:hypothetical protein
MYEKDRANDLLPAARKRGIVVESAGNGLYLWAMAFKGRNAVYREPDAGN